MDNLTQVISMALFIVFAIDIAKARKGMTNRTLLSFLLGKPNLHTQSSGLLPVGNRNHADETICMNKSGSRTRLSYFSDANNHFWFKLEKISANGTAIGEPRFEPATMKLQQRAMNFI